MRVSVAHIALKYAQWPSSLFIICDVFVQTQFIWEMDLDVCSMSEGQMVNVCCARGDNRIARGTSLEYNEKNLHLQLKSCAGIISIFDSDNWNSFIWVQDLYIPRQLAVTGRRALKRCYFMSIGTGARHSTIPLNFCRVLLSRNCSALCTLHWLC